ncbi:somatoliberin [Astyanax mexicanus]|uniref:somatoliberin n=1 Tax=Astyanax mexicanus TaxID=7994 RepID=UPI0020CB45C4|nr:somatoliberin [Astyanax mexicanus]
MMERAVVLALCCCMLMPDPCAPLYPSLRFGQRATAILMSSSLEDPLQLPTDYSTAHSQEVEFRSGRHADAIFTNSYRKVLGQISARKFLQTIMGKRFGPTSERFVKRQSGIFEDTFKQDLASIEREQSYRTKRTAGS